MAVTQISTAVPYLGELFQTVKRPNAFLKLAGHFAGKSMGEAFGYTETMAKEFPIGVTWSLPAPAQPAILEGATAPAPGNRALTQTTNVIQIFQEAVQVTYLAQSDKAISGVVPIPQGAANGPVQNPRSVQFQVMTTLEKIAQDANYSFLNGVFANPANPATTALKTRGIITAVATNTNDQSGDVTAMTAALYRKYITDTLATLIQQTGFSVDDTFTVFAGVVEFSNICAAWEALGTMFFMPEISVVGVKVRKIVTRFGTLNLVLDPDVPAAKILIANMGVTGLVGLPVPNKGVLFEEPLYKAGGFDQTQIYGQLGVDHGPEYFHALLTVRANVAL